LKPLKNFRERNQHRFIEREKRYGTPKTKEVALLKSV
jgi:hypothetical protein